MWTLCRLRRFTVVVLTAVSRSPIPITIWDDVYLSPLILLRAEQKDKSVYFCIVRPRGYGQLSVECVDQVDPRGPCPCEQIAELSSRSGMHSLYTSKNEDVSQLKDQAATEEPCESGKVDNVFEEELLELMEIPLLTARSRCSTAPARAFTALCMS